MAERDRFELDLAAALRDYALGAPTEVRPVDVARHVADAYPRRRGMTARWGFGLSPTLGWALLLIGLLLAAVAGGLVAGAWRADRSILVMASPMPAAPPVAAGTDILATTSAKALPAQATCPPGTNPDTPGPADQDRPAIEYGAVAFDRHAGMIIALTPDNFPRPRTWTFDVCTNTWQRMNPPEEPAWNDPVTLVYDADSDRTLGFARDRLWSYDLAADRWTVVRWFTEEIPYITGWGSGDRTAAVYHDPSGLVIVYDGQAVWAYDIETDTMAPVRQLPDATRPAGTGLPADITIVVYDRARNLLIAASAAPGGVLRQEGLQQESDWAAWLADTSMEIWAFDPETGAWRLLPSEVPARIVWEGAGYFFGPVSRATFDAATGVTVFISADGWVEAYDGERSWSVHPGQPVAGDAADAGRCATLEPVYDAVNGRIVCQAGGGGATAFSTSTGTWRWLLEPTPEPGPPP
jgi:hypothetical protein